MHWQRIIVSTALVLVWLAFVAWQYQRYLHERALIHETVHQQAHSVMNAVVGGMKSHRGQGRFFGDQVQGMLDELVTAEDVLAVTVMSETNGVIFEAGRKENACRSPDLARGDTWLPNGFRLVERFQMPSPVEGPHADDPGGGGRGWGRGRRFEADPEGSALLPDAEGEVVAALLLDRARADTLTERAAWTHGVVGVAGLLLAACLAFAWQASVRLVAAKGHTRLLENEAKHLRDLNQAAAGLAHETRNPLGLIRGWAQRLTQHDASSGQHQEHAQAVIEECDRVTARINQFLAFARPCDPSPHPVDLPPLVDELRTILQPDLEAKGLRLECHGPPAGRPLVADRELLRQSLFNMVLNAIHFAPQGDTVRVDVVSSDSFCIEVADRGPGVPKEAVESLFTPYFTTRPNGTGLGLATVGRIAAAHDWETGYRPRPGGGSIFFIDGIHG